MVLTYYAGFCPERATWQYRAIAYTTGNKSTLGAFIIAMLGRKVSPPCFHPQGYIIQKSGQVWGLYKAAPNVPYRAQIIWASVQEMADIFRGLAAELKLSDGDTLAMFDELRKACAIDRRAVSVLE